MRGGGIASTLSARRLDLEEDDAPSKAVPADKVDTGVKGQLYKPGRKGDVEVLSGKVLVEKIHEQLAQAQENGANYCNLLWFILYVGLYVMILGMQRSPPEAFMVEESIKNSLFGESTRTVEYSTGEISTTMESSSHIFEWLENSVIKSIFVDPTCGDGICDTPLEYPQWLDYGCSEDCGTYSSKLTSTVVVNVTAAFEDDEEIEDASWNLCSITHDVCYFSSSQLFTTRNESQVHEVDLLDGVWEVQLKASRGGIVGQIYTESSQLVTVAEIVNGTIGGNETSDANYTDTFVEYYTYVDTTRTIIAEWTACKDTSDSVSQEDLQLIQQSCEDATGEVKRICSAEDCEACSEAKCSLYADCAFNDTLDECYTLTCGNEPQACPYCADEDTCEANADCIWDESCKALCSAADCTSEACTVSQHACDVYSGGLCFWEGTGDTPCRTATDEEKCEYSCATCTQSLCEENSVCTFYRSECLDADDVVQTDNPSASPTAFPTAAPTSPPTPSPTQTTGGAPSQSTPSPTSETSCTDDCTLCSDSDACFTSPAACAWTGSACREEVDMSQYTCDDACHACDYSDCTSADTCYWSDGACYPESGLCETDCTFCKNAAKCRKRASFCEFSDSCTMLELCVNACEYCFSENECAFHPECVWDGLACAEASCSNTCSLCDEESTCTAQDGCSWTSLLGLGSCADESRRRELQTEVCGSMSTCEACSDDPTMCEKKNGCEFDYQSWSCSGFQEITASCDEASGGFCTSALLQNGFCDDECNIGECGYDQGACADTANLLTYICSDMCYCNMLADDVCDAACDTAACGFDLGDCCERVFTSELDVQFELWNHFTPETVERLTPDPLLPRSRYLATVNRLIGGVLVLQTRYERGNCSSQRFAALANDCFTGEQSTAPFGADPVFLRSSSLNTDEAVYKSKSSYYNLSDPEQVSALGLPYGFHYFAASRNLSAGGSIEGFPVYFDANLGSTRASEFLAYMQEGFYLDADTEGVDVLMVTYNAALRMFANTKVTFSFEYGGRVRMAYTVQSFRAEPYATDADLTRLFLETVFVILTALNFVSELRDFFRDFWRTGKPLTYFKSLWNYVDMVNIWLLVWNVISWAMFFTTWTLHYDPKERYNVYLDLDAEANFLAANETGMNEMLSFMVLSNQMSDQMGIYTALNGAALVLMVLRVLKVLDFQQRMGLVTRTISNAAVDLAHFAVLFFVVFSLYGSLAYIIFGSAIVGFSTLPRALNSCFSILLGDISVIDELLVHPNVGAAVIFYYSFIFLAYFILMNILLAILVEAFVEVKRSAEFSKSLPSEVLQILRSSARSLKPFRTENYMADSEIVELLSDWVAESRIIEESEKLGRRTFNTEGFSANSEQLQEVLECELARVRQLTRGDSHLTEVAAVLGHKATSPLDTILSEDDDDNMSKLAETIAKNVLHRYGTGADVVQSRPRIAPAPSSPGHDRASGRRASATLKALRRRTLAFAQGAVSPKSRAIRMTRFSQRYASGGKDEQLNAIVDQIIEERVREEDELAED